MWGREKDQDFLSKNFLSRSRMQIIMFGTILILSFVINTIQLIGAVTKEDICSMDPDFGGCSFYTPVYYYNRFTGDCHEFIYGGCLGNKNIFETKEECQKFCSGMEVEKECDQNAARGPCEGYIPRYYFDRESKECKLFIYGGCRGNANNYRTEKECMNTCQKVEEFYFY